MANRLRIGIVGAGDVGQALGYRLATTGFPVRFGVRGDKSLVDLLVRCGPTASASGVAEAVQFAEVIFLAVPGAAAVEVARALSDCAGKILVDCTNPLRWDQGPVWNPPAEGSNAAAIAAAVPDVRVVKGFNTFGAEFHADPDLGGLSIDVPLASDDLVAKEAVGHIASAAGFTPVDAGPLRNAAALENLAVLWIQLAVSERMGRDVAFKLVRRR